MVERARLEQTENGLVPPGEDALFDRGGTAGCPTTRCRDATARS